MGIARVARGLSGDGAGAGRGRCEGDAGAGDGISIHFFTTLLSVQIAEW